MWVVVERQCDVAGRHGILGLGVAWQERVRTSWQRFWLAAMPASRTPHRDAIPIPPQMIRVPARRLHPNASVDADRACAHTQLHTSATRAREHRCSLRSSSAMSVVPASSDGNGAYATSCEALAGTAWVCSGLPAGTIPCAAPSQPPTPSPPSTRQRTDQVDGGHSMQRAIGELLRKTPAVSALPRVRPGIGQTPAPADGQPDRDAIAAWKERRGDGGGASQPGGGGSGHLLPAQARACMHASAHVHEARRMPRLKLAFTLVLGDGQDGKGVKAETKQASGFVCLQRPGRQPSSADCQAHISTAIVHRKHALRQRLVSPHDIAAPCASTLNIGACAAGVSRRADARTATEADESPECMVCTGVGCAEQLTGPAASAMLGRRDPHIPMICAEHACRGAHAQARQSDRRPGPTPPPWTKSRHLQHHHNGAHFVY